MKYMTVKEAGEKWGLKERRVRALCQSGRVAGIVRSGRSWLIPSDANKPPVGKERSNATGGERMELHMNPIYCETHSGENTLEETLLCEAALHFFQGQFDTALSALSKLEQEGNQDSCLALGYILWYVICLDTEASSIHRIAIAAKLKKLFYINRDLVFTQALVDSYTKNKHTCPNMHLIPEKFIPAFVYGKISHDVMDDLAGRAKLDVNYVEWLIKLLPEEEQPGILLYIHVLMTLYYYLMQSEDSYNYHLSKALEIALPRKWYTPLAEYSYCLTWSEVKAIDPEAYADIMNLSRFIVGNYQKSGLFSKALPMFSEVSPTEIKVAFMIAQDKSNLEISSALGISLYRVKAIVQKIYDHTGAADRAHMAELIRAQFKVLF